MLEKRLAAVAAQSFIADGTALGVVTIADASLFKVKQRVFLAASGQDNQELEVKRVEDATHLIVGPVAGNIFATVDLSAFTVAAGATISANEQKRPIIPVEESARAVFEEEPTVANRSILVDRLGRIIDADSPLATTATLGDITIDEVGQGSPNTAANAWPVKITDGTDTVVVNSNGSLNVNILGSADVYVNHNEISSVGSGVETTLLTFTAPVGGRAIKNIAASGDNVALFRVKLDGTLLAHYRTSWTDFNASFPLEGVAITAGQVLTITVVHSRPSLGAFEATLITT